MAPKSPPSEEEVPASADEKPVSGKGPAGAAVRPIGDKPSTPPPDDRDDEDEDDDLVVYTAQEAAGALSTFYSFVRPYLGNYKRLLAFVSLGIFIETLF